MKNNILFTVLTLSILNSAIGQTVFPTYETNPDWAVIRCDLGYPTICDTQSWQYSNDTLMCGYEYSVFVRPNNNTYFIRSDILKTWIKGSRNCWEDEYLMYDYSLSIGDTTFIAWNMQFNPVPQDMIAAILIAIDTITIFGAERERYEMFFVDQLTMYWIKGIGSDRHPFHSTRCLDYCEVEYELLCYDSSDVQLYQNPEYNSCYYEYNPGGIGMSEFTTDDLQLFPNPANHTLNVRLPRENERLWHISLVTPNDQSLFAYNKQLSIDGRLSVELPPSLANGIYFIKVSNNDNIYSRKFIKTNF